MAQSYDRRINLYINIDGKEVENNVKAIRGEMSRLINEQAKLTIGTDDYVKKGQSIKQLKGILAQHRDNITETKSAWSGLIDQAKGLLPALSFAALSAAAVKAFTAIKNSTHATSDVFEFSMAAMNNGVDHFWKTLATGDWTNFTTRLREAIEVGYKYASMLDEVDDKTRALSMVESDARGEELKLEEKLKNKGLGKDAQIQAGKDRIALEQKLSLDRQNISNERFDAEVLLAQQQTQLSRAQLIQVAKDIDSKKKLEAQAYNDKVTQYNNLRALNTTRAGGTAYGGATVIQKDDTPEIKALKSQIDSTEGSVKEYAGFMKQYDVLTLDQQKKFVSAYVMRNEAINSAPENLKKVITRVNNLLAGVEDNGAKIEDKALKDRKEASDKAIEQLDAANAKIMSNLITQYENEGWTDARFKTQQSIAEQAYLEEKKKLLEKYGQSTVGVDNQINSKRIDAQKDLHALMAEEQKRFDDIQAQVNEDNYNADQDLQNSISKDLSDNLEADNAKQKKILEDRARTYQMISETIVSSMSDMLSGSLEENETYGEALVLMALQILKQMAPIWAAQILGLSLSSPESVATWGVAGLIKYALLMGLMEGAIGLAENGVKSGIKKKQEAAKHASGGFTQGEATYIAGEAGQEWISPNWMLKNRVTAPIIAGLENARKNPIVVSSGAIKMFADGGLTSEASILNSKTMGGFFGRLAGFSPIDKLQSEMILKLATVLDGLTNQTQNVQSNTNKSQSIDVDGLTKAINLNTQASAMLMKHGVQFPIVPFKKQLDEISDLINQTGMGGFSKK